MELHHAELQETWISPGDGSQPAGESGPSAGKTLSDWLMVGHVRSKLQSRISDPQVDLRPGWVAELPVDYDVYLGRDTDTDALRQIHLYRVL